MAPGNLALFTSDLHGNEAQYKRLFEYCAGDEIGCLILGGDLFPNPRSPDVYVQVQKDFASFLIDQFIAPFKRTYPDVSIYVLPGNDDSATAYRHFCASGGDLFANIHLQRRPLTKVVFNREPGADIFGYAFVPLTPFLLKDWEKPDTKEASGPGSPRVDSVLRSEGNELVSVARLSCGETITDDFKPESVWQNCHGTFYVFHSPPMNCALDICRNGSHLGSHAIREFIESHKPPVTFHGHIHESVELSGKPFDRIGQTYCFSAGNNPRNDSPYAILLDMKDPDNAFRKQL